MTDQVTGSAALQGKEISKLAREYAEYVNSDMDFVDDAEHDFVIGKWTKDVAEVISWLLRDHCIVPKSEVRKEIDRPTRKSASTSTLIMASAIALRP